MKLKNKSTLKTLTREQKFKRLAVTLTPEIVYNFEVLI